MRENLYDEENRMFEKFDIQQDNKPFIENKCPINLGERGYIKLEYNFDGKKKSKSSSKNFISSKICYLFDFKIFEIFFVMFFSFTFYDLLITFIIYHDIKLLIYFLIIYFLASLVQFIIIPRCVKFKTKRQFAEDLRIILNSYVLIKVYKNNTKKAMYQAKYTVDISGTLNIPNEYKYAKIKEVQIFAKNDFNKFVENFKKINEYPKYDYKLMYDGLEIPIDPSTIYSLDSEDDTYSINKCTSFFSIFLLQWINAIYYKCSKSNKCINIYLAKLLTNEMTYSPTNFTIHGKTYVLDSYKINPLENNEEFDKELENYETKIREKKEREEEIRREKERNTKTLSYFENGKNFEIEVYKYYETVYIKFDSYSKSKGHKRYKTELGPYDSSIKERIVRKDKLTIYYPKGFNTRIEVIRGLDSYTVTIGDDYTETFPYYNA